MTGLLTTQQIAPIVGVGQARTVAETLRRHGIAPAEKHGRVYLFNASDLENVPSWRSILQAHRPEVEKVALRKERSDRGISRKYDMSAVALIVERARLIYLSAGRPNVRLAVEKAKKSIERDAVAGKVNVTPEAVRAISEDWLYRRWIMRKDEYMEGPYYAEGWESLWNGTYKQHTAALTSVYTSRSWWQIAENAGWAGEGHGFAWAIVLDDRTADVFTLDPVTGERKPPAIYVWDALTGVLLWVEPCEEITTTAYMRAIISTVWYHGLDTMPLIVMENARAAASERIPRLLRALYTPESIDALWNDRNLRRLTNGAEPPIFRNLPHIARSLFKAAAERGFKTIKDEHDSFFSPTTFQGGNRSEAVQLQRSNQPWWFLRSLTHGRHAVDTNAIIPTEGYFRSVMGWAWNEYLDRERGSLKQWARAKGLPATRRAMMDYYGASERAPGIGIDMTRFGHVIYECSPIKRYVTVRYVGRLDVQIEGQTLNLSSMDLGPEVVGRRVGVCPSPSNPNHYLVCLLKHGSKVDVERFLTVATNYVSTNVDDDVRYRIENRAIRETIASRIDERVAMIRGTDNLSHVPEAIRNVMPVQVDALPHGPAFIDQIQETEEVVAADVRIGHVDELNDDDMDDEISQIINL